jgi:hypothetical protein
LCRLREALRRRGVRNIWASDPESGVDEEEEEGEGDDEVDAEEEEDDDMLDMVRPTLTSVSTQHSLCARTCCLAVNNSCFPAVSVISNVTLQESIDVSVLIDHDDQEVIWQLMTPVSKCCRKRRITYWAASWAMSWAL